MESKGIEEMTQDERIEALGKKINALEVQVQKHSIINTILTAIIIILNLCYWSLLIKMNKLVDIIDKLIQLFP